MPNKYTAEIRNPVIPIGPSIAYIPLSQEMFACVETRDLHLVSGHRWYAHRCGKVYYAVRNIKINGKWGNLERMHQRVLGVRAGFTSDHKEPGNGLDCRRANLRFASPQDQLANTRIGVRNKSGYKGVYRSPDGKWTAQIKVNQKIEYLGRFALKEDAIEIRRIAAIKYFGEFARMA